MKRTLFKASLVLALCGACGDDEDSPNETQGGADAAVDAAAMSGDDAGSGSDASADASGNAGDAAAGTDGSADASGALPDAGAPDAALEAGANVPCTKTVDVTVNVPSNQQGCDFVLSGAPTSPSYLTLKLDGMGLYQDDPDGFYYESGTLTLAGAACDTVKDGSAHELQISLFCQ